jgi:hypothetical protein
MMLDWLRFESFLTGSEELLMRVGASLAGSPASEALLPPQPIDARPHKSKKT